MISDECDVVKSAKTHDTNIKDGGHRCSERPRDRALEAAAENAVYEQRSFGIEFVIPVQDGAALCGEILESLMFKAKSRR